MTDAERAALRLQLVDHEGLRLKPYRCTSGKLTFLVGYNIDDRGLGPVSQALGRVITPAAAMTGLTQEDALRVLDADITMFEGSIRASWPNYDALDGVRQRAVVDFVFNLGLGGAGKFVSAIRFADLALAQKPGPMLEACWTAAAYHLADSVWARQVDDGLAGRKGRADRVCHMIRTGRDPGMRT